MCDEHRDLFQDLHLPLVGLFPGRLDADDDIAQNLACEMPQLAFAHREGEHIGRAIFMAIDAIELMDGFVVS